MIAARGSLVALLGGWRGDRLWLSRGGGPFERLADLGWNEERQVAPQRRILLAEDACFVLEPEGEDARLDGPVRVRRFDLDGRERGVESGAREVADPWSTDWLYFRVHPQRGRLGFWLRAVDPESGRPVVWRGAAETGLRSLRRVASGTPLLRGDRLHLALREGGLLLWSPEGARLLRGEASTAARLASRGACAAGIVRGTPGVWIEGEWRALPGPPPFGGDRIPLSPLVASHGDGGVAMLRRRGGALGVVGGPPATLPEGRYSGLVRLPEGLFALAADESPRLVAAVL